MNLVVVGAQGGQDSGRIPVEEIGEELRSLGSGFRESATRPLYSRGRELGLRGLRGLGV